MLTSAVLVSAPLLSGCGTASDATTMGGKAGQAHGNNGKPGSTTTTTPTPTPTPTPTTSITSVTYDTSIGNGVDVNGFADLPLNTGAKRFYVNSSTGSDTNSCSSAQSASAPKATIKSAVGCVTTGEGDQVLVAEGTSYPRGLAYIGDKGGASPQYPFVIQSYDPTDPTNEAKFGRASGNRPIINVSGADMINGFIQGGGTSQKYRAIRGLEFNPGNLPDQNLNAFTNTYGTPDYLLFENDIFAYSGVAMNFDGGGATRTSHIIFRNCSFYGEWGNSIGDHQQGIFASNSDGLTIEDSVFWHNGWNVNATRASDPTVGGPTIFNHPIYAQDNTRNTTVRRNIFINTSTDGGVLKGGGTYVQNLSLNNPIGVGLGGGNDYSTAEPNGVDIQVAYNAILGGGVVSTTSTAAADWGIATVNGAPGSLVHHNVLAYSSAMAGYGLMADAPYDTSNIALPNYVSFQSNVTYKWSKSGNIQAIHMSSGGADISLIHASYNSHLWDDPTSGTNTNDAMHVFPNAYTEATLLAALGYSDETSFINDLIRNPEKHVQRNAVLLMLNGYGVDTSAMTW
jgi:hypothetical protein